MKYILIATVTAVAAAFVCSCHTLDDDRIPVEPVNMVFPTVADWNVYGVAGALDYRTFIRSKRIPSNYPYTAMSYTGFGGILLVGDVLGNPQAFDLACPVERRQDVIIHINADAEHLAECPECGSRYNVFSLLGHPVSGPAATNGYALRRYRVGPGRSGDYMVISF